jgi:hypothetical protein
VKKLLPAMFLASLFSVIGAATPVDFTSTGTLACNGAVGCAGGGASITFSNAGAILTITYTSNSESDLNAPASPSFAGTNFGQLSVACTTCAGATATFALSGATLSLGVNQGTDPFNASNANMFAGALSGSLTVTGGTSFGGSAQVSFVPLSSTLVSGTTTVSYFLQQPVNPPAPPGGYLLSIGNTTTFQGAVSLDNTAIPEPGSLVLMSVGLFAIGLVGRRRFSRP